MAVFDYPYRKSINITTWVLQIIVCLIYIIVLALAMLATKDTLKDTPYRGVFAIAGGIYIGIAGLTIVLDIVEMILIGCKRMHPALYLTSACIKTPLWTILFIRALAVLWPLGIVFGAVLAATSIVQLVYGAKLVHRKRRGTLQGGGYAPAANPGGAHVETGYDQQQPLYASHVSNTNTAYDAGYSNPLASGYHYQIPQGTEYKPPTSPAPQQQYYGQQQAPGSYELGNHPNA